MSSRFGSARATDATVQSAERDGNGSDFDDADRLEPGVDYEINLQESKFAYEHGDVASEKLFTFVDPKVFERPTFHLFYVLLDNYERGTGVAEVVTNEELAENRAFLNAILDTAPMRYAFNWLAKKRLVPNDITAFRNRLDLLWFSLYRRETHNDSCGFEHVFVGEERDGKISGCHNWIQIYNEERLGRMDYRGAIKPKQRGRSFLEPLNHEQLVTIQFSWDREIKPVSTSLIGVSPEFEMALYTMCFLNGQENNPVQLGPYQCNIKCFSIGQGERRKIGSAFPEALPMTEAQAATKIQAQFRGQLARQKQGQSDRPPRNAQQYHQHHQLQRHDQQPNRANRAQQSRGNGVYHQVNQTASSPHHRQQGRGQQYFSGGGGYHQATQNSSGYQQPPRSQQQQQQQVNRSQHYSSGQKDSYQHQSHHQNALAPPAPHTRRQQHANWNN